jgi:hypothetical protein
MPLLAGLVLVYGMYVRGRGLLRHSARVVCALCAALGRVTCGVAQAVQVVCTFWLQRWGHTIRTSCGCFAAQAGTRGCASLGPGSCLRCCTRAQLARLCCYGSSPDCCLLCNKRDVVVRSRVQVQPDVCDGVMAHAVVLVCCWWRYSRHGMAMPACCRSVLCCGLLCCAKSWCAVLESGSVQERKCHTFDGGDRGVHNVLWSRVVDPG